METIIHPSDKDQRRTNYLRSHGKQDHGTRGTLREKISDPAWSDMMAPGRVVRSGVSHEDWSEPTEDELHTMSSLELGRAADRLLRLDPSENPDFQTLPPLDFSTESVQDTKARDREVHAKIEGIKDEHDSPRIPTDHELAAAEHADRMRLDRQTRGRFGSTTAPDVLYQGAYGDDDDISDTSVNGYLVR